MTKTSHTLIRRAIVLATLVAALALPAVAFASSATKAPDWFERYAAAHPYGQSSVNGLDGRSADTLDAVAIASSGTSAPDVLERYAAAHPYGDGLVQSIVDGRSADTIDAATNAQVASLIPSDGRSADTLDAVDEAQQTALTPTDGRSPDKLEAAAAPQPVVLRQARGFDWGDAGVGAGFTGGVLVLAAAVLMLRLRHHARQRMQTT